MSNKKVMGSVLLGVALLTGIGLIASWHKQSGGQHDASSHAGGHPDGNLSEGGQSMFAALIEVVNVFESNPDTNWSRVDIDGLRDHLLDMDDLVINTDATTSVVDDKTIVFEISARQGNDAIGAVHRMTQAHSRFIEQSRGWKIEPQVHDTGATVAITVDKPSDVIQLKALGFYGFMSLDSHHQAHHFQIAQGIGH